MVTVVPAPAGIQNVLALGCRILGKQPLDSRLRGKDGGGAGRTVAGREGRWLLLLPGTAASSPYAIIRVMFHLLGQISPRLAAGGRAALPFLAARSGLLICGIFLLAGLVAADDYGIGADVTTRRLIADGNLKYILGRADHIETVHLQERVYGVAFELPLWLAEGALGLEDFHYIYRFRLTLTHLFFIIGGFFCCLLAYRLFGNRLIALFALLLFLLHPRIYGHSFVNSSDLPFVSMFVVALYLLERAFRRDTAGAFILLGLAVGLLTNLRIMGIMLFPAVIAMRGLDLFYAKTGPERKAVLGTAGLFLLASSLTLYAVTPYAWANPVDYLVANLDLMVNHPTVTAVLFQGAWHPSNQLPPHYNAAWFVLTTPPLILLLGFIGIAAVAAGARRRPGAVFGNNGLRFQLLLLAAFLLPPLAAALAGSNQYNEWRHFYFISVPFGLLAVAGLHWLAAALSRQSRRRAGMYGLAGLGLGLIMLQMIQLHPLQYIYFNFLADRTTPEYLRTQYILDYWRLSYRQGLEQLLERHPGEALAVPIPRRYRAVLPAAARQRLAAGGGGRADYELIYLPEVSQPDFAFNSAYQRRIYNNTLVAARPLTAARMTPDAIAAYQELYPQAITGEPIIRADYNVYLDGKRLVFVRENCPPEGPESRFGVRIFPHHPETLPPPRRPGRSYGSLGRREARLGSLCLAVFQLPDYARGDLILSWPEPGQGEPAADLPLREELYSLEGPGLGELIADHRREKTAAPAEGFDVFLDRDAGRNRLIYAKENCTPAEYATRVTLHIYPVNSADLPAHNRGNRFDNRDFLLDDYGGRPGGECIAVVPLPDYPIAALRTGQANRWEVNLYPPADGDYLRAVYADLADIQPAGRGVFDLYLQEGRLVYGRETCAAADMAAGFFLHIIPADVADLPRERQAAGFANLDFVFERWGGAFDGKCVAAVPLPDYPVKAIRTGQHIPGRGELWAAELMVAP